MSKTVWIASLVLVLCVESMKFGSWYITRELQNLNLHCIKLFPLNALSGDLSPGANSRRNIPANIGGFLQFFRFILTDFSRHREIVMECYTNILFTTSFVQLLQPTPRWLSPLMEKPADQNSKTPNIFSNHLTIRILRLPLPPHLSLVMPPTALSLTP